MKKNLSRMGLPVGFLVLILLLLVPTPPDLSTAGHRMLAILVFSVIIWMTEAVAYPVSSGIIMSLMAFLLGQLHLLVDPRGLGRIDISGVQHLLPHRIQQMHHRI